MRKENLHWIIPLLEKLRDNPDAELYVCGEKRDVQDVGFLWAQEDYSVHIPRKYRLYQRRSDGDHVFCVTDDATRVKILEQDLSIIWLTDWLPVPTGP